MNVTEGARASELGKLGFRLSGFKAWPLNKALKALAEIGYKSVELCLEHPDLDPETLTAARIARVKHSLNAHNLRISAVSYHGKKDGVAQALEKQKRGIEITQSFGANTLVVGSALVTTDPQGCSTFQALEDLIKSAEGSNVIVAVEPEPDTVINGMYEFSLLAAHMAGSPLGLNLDIGHAALTEGDPAAVIQEWAPFIVHTHVEDIRRGEHVHLLPGDGHLDLLRLIHKLRDCNYQGDLTIDLFDILDAPQVWAQQAMERFRRWFE